MNYTAQQIADLFDGEIIGNHLVTANSLSSIEDSKEDSLSFLGSRKYLDYIYHTKASIVLINRSIKPKKEVSATLIRVDNPEMIFLGIMREIDSSRPKRKGISSLASIADNAEIGENVFIDDFVKIGSKVVIADGVSIESHSSLGDGCTIGENTIIYGGVQLYDQCHLGKDTIIHSGTVIGSDGFGFKPDGKGGNIKVPQLGNVIVGDDVEIGANCSIDRATLGSTYIRDGVKLDNQIQIAHNCDIGENTLIASHTGISGSAKIGKNCMIGGQVGIVDHLRIADRTIIVAQSGLGSHIEKEGTVVAGTPAFDFRQFKRSFVHYKNFDQIVDRIDELEKKMNSQ